MPAKAFYCGMASAIISIRWSELPRCHWVEGVYIQNRASSQNYTAITVPASFLSVIVKPLSPRSSRRAGILRVVHHSTTLFMDDLTRQVDEDLIDVDSSPCRCLVIGLRAPILCELKRFGSWYHAVLLHIALVSSDHERDVIIIFDAYNLLSQLRELVKRILVRNGEDQEKSLALLHVELSQCCELFGACRIQSAPGQSGGSFYNKKATEEEAEKFLAQLTSRASHVVLSKSNVSMKTCMTLARTYHLR
jgi:hypothetical protein